MCIVSPQSPAIAAALVGAGVCKRLGVALSRQEGLSLSSLHRPEERQLDRVYSHPRKSWQPTGATALRFLHTEPACSVQVSPHKSNPRL